MKLKAALRYRTTYQLKSLGIFYLYYFLFTLVIPVVVGLLFTGHIADSMNADILFPTAIFMAIVAAIGIKSDFKLFIQNGMSRLNIFLANIITNFLLSLASTIVTFIIYGVFHSLHISQINYEIFLSKIYAPNSMMMQFLLTLAFLFLSASIGLIINLFLDRITGMKRLIIGSGIVLLPILFIALYNLMPDDKKAVLFDFLKTILGYSSGGFHAAPFTLTLVVLSIVISVIAYLMNRRREIKKING